MLLRRLLLNSRNTSPAVQDSKYLTITALEDECKVSFNQDYQYSYNQSSWNSGTSSTIITLGEGESVFLKGNISNSSGSFAKFTLHQNCTLGGNCMSMLYGDDADIYDHVPDYGFCELFRECDGIVTVDENFLPANSVGAHAYESMFHSCSSIVTPPKLNARVLEEACYKHTFYGCLSIEEFGILPATELAKSCYYYMFGNCFSLRIPPILPATELKEKCYYSMFFACSNLEKGPDLPALVLEDSSYYQMFYNCTNIKRITMLAMSISASYSTHNWLYNVCSEGVIYKNEDAQWDNFDCGIPRTWTVKTIKI